MKPTTIAGSTGFIGSRYCAMYPDETVGLPSRVLSDPLYNDTLWLRSTTSNYGPLNGDLRADIEVNLLHLTEGLKRARGPFTFVSSWFVYGAAAGTTSPAREADPCDPNGWYSITKLAAEKLVRSYCQTNGIPYRILRLCNVIGNDPRANARKAALEWMLAKVKRGEDVDVYTGDGYRNWLHVDDVCRAIHLCLAREDTLGGVTNIGAPCSVRTYDLIQHAIGVTGSKSRVNLVAPPRFHQVVQVESFHMDTTKLRGLGFVPDMDAYQAVERVLANMTL